MRYKACVFDFDLTLADSSKGILICFKHTLEQFGCKVPDDRTIYDTIGLPLVDAFDLLTGVPDDPRRYDMQRVYIKKADEVMVKYTYFYDGAVEGLKMLGEKGIKRGICSSKMRFRIEESFDEKAGCRPVDLILGLDDAVKPKPHPGSLLKCIELLGADKGDVLYVGDNIIDARTAENAGVDFAAVLTGSTTEEQFCTLPHTAIYTEIKELFADINSK